MNLRVHKYTGETYDADEWYRGAMGLWHNRKAEQAFNERYAAAVKIRREKRNANRVKRGQRRKSPSAFIRATDRFDKYLREDSSLTFREWLYYHGRDTK